MKNALALASLACLAAGCDTNLLFGPRDRVIENGPAEGEGEGDVAAEGEGDVAAEGEGESATSVCGGAVRVETSAPIAMGAARLRHAAVLLADGRVLLAAGTEDGFDSVKTAQLFDPATSSFSSTGDLLHGRYDFALAALDDGRAVAFGGFNNDVDAPDDNGDLSSTEIWDPQTGAWTEGPAMPEPRSGLSALAVGGGVVVVFGGNSDQNGYPNDVLLFDGADDSIALGSGNISEPRGSHTALELGDGRILMAGGYFTSSLADTDVIFPDGHAAATQAIPGPRRSACAALDDKGDGLFFGGLGGATTLDDVESYDPGQNTWHSAGALTTPRYACESVSLSCLALVCGGIDVTSCEAWDFATETAVPVVDDVGGEFSGSLTKIDDTHALFAGGFLGDGVNETARVISLAAP